MFFSFFRIHGHSMEPTIYSRQVILASSIPYMFLNPKINDIVVFKEKTSNKIVIKRIVKIEKNKYFMQGDNEEDSLDSNKFGWIDRKMIMGKIIYKFSI